MVAFSLLSVIILIMSTSLSHTLDKYIFFTAAADSHFAGID